MVVMAGKRLELGPTGAEVASNLSRLRKERGFNYTQLSNRLAECNRDIPPLAIRRIEEKNRRVDVDDLVALALALGVSPISLLLPDMPKASDPMAKVNLTGLNHAVHAQELWHWLQADITKGAPPSWAAVSRPLFEANGVPAWLHATWGE